MSNVSVTRGALPDSPTRSVWMVVVAGVTLALLGAWQMRLESVVADDGI
jgi:hypothetical protein